MTDMNRTAGYDGGDGDRFAREMMDIRERSRSSFRYGHPLAKRFGGPHALISVAEECGLRRDLKESFGETGDCILASAISMILTSKNVDDPLSNLDMFMAREILGISDRICDELIPDLMDRISSEDDGMDDLFRRRTTRAGDVYLTDDSFLKEPGNGDSTLAVVSDSGGTPVLLTRLDIPEDGDFTRMDLDVLLRGLGAENTIAIFEKRRATVDMYDAIIERGSRFVSAARLDIGDLIKMDELMVSEKTERLRNGTRYNVASVRMGIVDSSGLDDDADLFERSGTRAFVGEQHPLFAQCPEDRTVMLWVFSDSDKPEVDAERVRKRIAVIERRLRSLSPSAAMEQFHDTAGSLSRFFRISLNGDELNLSVDREALEDYVSNGPKALLSYGFDSWDDVMDAFETRDSMHSLMNAMSGQLSVPDGIPDADMAGVDCIRFCAMILWRETEKRLVASGIGEDVFTVMEWLNDTTSVGDGIRWKIIGLTPRNRKILNILGAPVQSKEFVTLPSNDGV